MNQSYLELIASYVHPKNSNNLRSHLRAIMTFDHRRLIRPGKKSGRILRSTTLLYKILSANLSALFLSYRPRTECSILQFCNTNCTHSIFRTIEGSRDGAVVRALALICGLSLLLVLFSAPRVFSPGTPVFRSPQKPTFLNSNSIRNARAFNT